MESLMKEIKILTEKFLIEGNGKLEERHYPMFSIAKFLLLKESILKKDTETGYLKFNNIINVNILPKIYKLYDYICTNGKVSGIDPNRIILSNDSGDNIKLKKALWTINKLRDSIAHGQYQYNFENKSIIVNNVSVNENSYSLECEIPIDFLNELNLLIINQNIYELPLDEHLAILGEKTDKIINSLDEKTLTIIDEELKDLYLMKNIKVNENNDSIGKEDHIQTESRKKAKKNYYIVKEDDIKNHLKVLFDKDISYRKFAEDHNILSYFQKLYYAENKKEIFHKIIPNFITDAEESKKVAGILEEIFYIIKDQIGNENNINGMISLYTYMTLTFSFDQEISPSYLKTSELQIDYESKNYNDIKNNIRNKSKGFTLYLNGQINKYKNNPDSLEVVRKNMLKEFMKFIADILNNFSKKNEMILRSIRNSVEHGNFTILNSEELELYDLPVQDDLSTIKFNCIVEPLALLKMTNSINDNTLKEQFNLSDFFDEIKLSCPENSIIYNELMTKIEEMWSIVFNEVINKNINVEKLFHFIFLTTLENTKEKEEIKKR